jgi:threonine aldolase
MPEVLVDLLSDTLTKPTDAMRAAMAAAPVGDDVFGEDPTVRELEQRVAGLLGHEDGLFTPSGTMANQLGLRLHVQPGEELVADSLAHVLRAEMGAAAALSGISARSWVADHGLLDAAQPLSLMVPDGGAYQVNTRLVVVENTHNFGGGTVQPLDQLQKVREGTSPLGIAMHLDGARVWNAHVATGVPLDVYGSLFDTVSVCLSKGLGAPVGSVLVGSRERMARARIWRKRFGGGMRQVGILAAAGLYALDHHVERLADDHARAHGFAAAAAQAAPGSVDPTTVKTNIVVLEVAGAGWTPAGFVEQAAARGIRLYPVSGTAVRLVWHLDVDDAGTDRAIAALVPLLEKGPDGA